jgi:hypothetical protein
MVAVSGIVWALCLAIIRRPRAPRSARRRGR